MIAQLTDILLGAMALYLLLGLIFSFYFYLKAGARIDEGTSGTPWHFKVIIFPGVVLFWSILFIKLIRKP